MRARGVGSEGGGAKTKQRLASSDDRVRKLSWKEERELDGLETHIQALEARKESLQAEVNASSADYQRLQELAGVLAGVEAELDAAMMRWFELSEVAASVG